MENEILHTDYKILLERIGSRYEQGQQQAVQAVNTAMVETYWHIGQYIVLYEQGGKTKAQYGKGLLETLSKDLSLAYGKGFSRSNLNYMRLFYQRFPICAELPHKLSWTHFVELLKIDDPLERSFYLQQTILERWSISMPFTDTSERYLSLRSFKEFAQSFF